MREQQYPQIHLRGSCATSFGWPAALVADLCCAIACWLTAGPFQRTGPRLGLKYGLQTHTSSVPAALPGTLCSAKRSTAARGKTTTQQQLSNGAGSTNPLPVGPPCLHCQWPWCCQASLIFAARCLQQPYEYGGKPYGHNDWTFLSSFSVRPSVIPQPVTMLVLTSLAGWVGLFSWSALVSCTSFVSCK